MNTSLSLEQVNAILVHKCGWEAYESSRHGLCHGLKVRQRNTSADSPPTQYISRVEPAPVSVWLKQIEETALDAAMGMKLEVFNTDYVPSKDQWVNLDTGLFRDGMPNVIESLDTINQVERLVLLKMHQEEDLSEDYKNALVAATASPSLYSVIATSEQRARALVTILVAKDLVKLPEA